MKVLKAPFSNLQEKNVALFLRIVETEINKKQKRNISFGPRKEKALGNFDNFYSVLKGISELSKYFEKKTNVKSFNIENRLGFRTPEIEKDIELDFYYDDQENDYDYDYDESQG